jgi:hypothetical protein
MLDRGRCSFVNVCSAQAKTNIAAEAVDASKGRVYSHMMSSDGMIMRPQESQTGQRFLWMSFPKQQAQQIEMGSRRRAARYRSMELDLVGLFRTRGVDLLSSTLSDSMSMSLIVL